MKPRSRFALKQRMTIAAGILCIVVIIIILQLWLFTSSMNAVLGGDVSILWPGALVSLVCLILNAGLFWYLYGLER